MGQGMPQKLLPLPWRFTLYMVFWPTEVHIANDISTDSSVLAQPIVVFTVQQSDTQTHRTRYIGNRIGRIFTFCACNEAQ